MDWAMSVLATNQTKRVIVAIHNAGSDSTPVSFSAQGQAIYDTLKVNTNFFLMMAGHRFGNDGEGSRSDTYLGHTVRTYVSDYQGRTNGGDGLMRCMRFSPSNSLVTITTYSPWTDTYEKDADSQMSFSYNMQLPSGAGSAGTPFVAVGTNSNVVPGTTNTFPWSGLQAGKTYEWYVKVTDSSGNLVTTPTRLFVAGTNVAPVASNLTVTVVGDQPSQIALAGFDANNDVLSYQMNGLPSHGFLTSVNATSGMTVYQPVHGFRGADRFSYHVSDSVLNSPLANVDVNVVAPTDADSDGLPDYWETKFGVTNANGDDDGDGVSNFAEYFANTNPTNAASALKIISATYDVSGNFVLTWQSVGNTRYRIQYSDDATTFFDLTRPVNIETDSSADGTASTQTFVDSTASAETTRYYRVKVMQ
jgi:hypothetical protein